MIQKSTLSDSGGKLSVEPKIVQPRGGKRPSRPIPGRDRSYNRPATPTWGQRLLHRQRMVLGRLATAPSDVRWAAKLLGGASIGLSYLFLEYARVRSFMDAVCGGTCNTFHVKRREKECANCDWHHIHDGRSYCRGCDCPRWRGSELSVKLRLARFVCPRGRFGTGPGWLSRAWHWIQE